MNGLKGRGINNQKPGVNSGGIIKARLFEGLVRAKDVAEALQVSTRVVNDMRVRGVIPFVTLKCRPVEYRFDLAEVMRVVTSRSEQESDD